MPTPSELEHAGFWNEEELRGERKKVLTDGAELDRRKSQYCKDLETLRNQSELNLRIWRFRLMFPELRDERLYQFLPETYQATIDALRETVPLVQELAQDKPLARHQPKPVGAEPKSNPRSMHETPDGTYKRAVEDTIKHFSKKTWEDG